MKSVLISIDFTKDENGNFKPLELNTATRPGIRLPVNRLTVENFESEASKFFDHQSLKSYLDLHSLNKITLISSPQTTDPGFWSSFCDFYNLEFSEVKIQLNEAIPDITEDENTLVIRLAYDPYAIIDDVYAADNFEFHNLIASESFSHGNTFSSDLNFDTNIEFKNSVQPNWPNYILKPRTPNYEYNNYPVLYNFQNIDELNNVKSTLKSEEFLSEFLINSSSLSETNGCVTYYRNMSLICGDNLDVVNIINYKNINQVSIDNELFVYDSDINEDRSLNLLHSCRFLPYYKLLKALTFHFDETDNILDFENNNIQANNLMSDKDNFILKTIKYDQNSDYDAPISSSQINNFAFTTSSINQITEKPQPGIFVNVTATSDEYGEFSWFDGEANPYYIQRAGTDIVEFNKIGAIDVGDFIYAYDFNRNIHIKLQITSFYYDIQARSTYIMTLDPEPLFFVQITNDTYNETTSPLYLIQHNACSPVNCFYSTATCANCSDCSKFASYCIDCGGAAVTQCI